MKRYWLSFYFTNEDGDYRPLSYPPAPGILGYWNSGMRLEDYAITLCIFVEAESDDKARELVAKEWPESVDAEWRFFKERDDNWLPNDRFQLHEWGWERANLSKDEYEKHLSSFSTKG